jgi:hypothetical protein
VRYGNAVEVSNAGDDNTYRDADQDRPGNDGKNLAVRGKNARKQTDPASALKITNKKKEKGGRPYDVMITEYGTVFVVSFPGLISLNTMTRVPI